MYSHLVKPEDSQLEQFLAGCLAGVLSKYARDTHCHQNQQEHRQKLKSAYARDGNTTITIKPKRRRGKEIKVSRRASMTVPQYDTYGDSYEL